MVKILVVEDEDHIRETITDILELVGHDILATHNGQQALQSIRRFHPDLIISDVNMPKMDGFEMLIYLRSKPTTRNIPLIFLTAKTERTDFRYGMSIGADDYLTKPFTAEELLTAVDIRLKRYQALKTAIDNEVSQLQLLRQMDHELSERLEPDWVINMIFDWALRQSNANYAFLFLKDDLTDQIMIRFTYGDNLSFQSGEAWESHPVTDAVLLSGRPLILSDINTVSKLVPIIGESQSLLAVPILFQNSINGVIVLESSQQQAFDHTTANMLTQMANRASVALQHAQLFRHLVEQREAEENLRNMFQKFVSAEVVNALEDENTTTKEIDTTATILFCDIRGFTSYSERHTAGQVVAMLNQYIPIVVEAARLYGGNVNKFGGDSVMIIYGAPNQVAEPCYQAVLTALQIIRSLPALNDKLFIDSEFQIKVGIGINTGQVIAGTIGSEDRQEYTVIGDTVNLAARIESLNKTFTNHSIFITDATYQNMGERVSEFQMTNIGKIDIRGKSEPIQIWAVDDFNYKPD